MQPDEYLKLSIDDLFLGKFDDLKVDAKRRLNQVCYAKIDNYDGVNGWRKCEAGAIKSCPEVSIPYSFYAAKIFGVELPHL